MAIGSLSLEEIGSFLAKLAEKSHSVYWLSSSDFSKIQYISPAFDEIWGRPREILYKHPEEWITYLHPDDAKNYNPIQAMADRVARLGEQARYEENYRIIRPDGSIRWIIDRGFPIYDEDGNCCAVTGVAVDVTKEKLAEEELRIAKEQAEAASQLKNQFIRNMEHDIRTPFGGIFGMATILSNRETDPEKKSMMNDIARCASELLSYCNTILDFSRIEAGEIPILFKNFDLREFLERVMRMELVPAQFKKLDLRLKCDPAVPNVLVGDSFRLQRVLINLVSNSIKFTESGFVELRVSLEKIDDLGRRAILKFEVEDTGAGIPEDKQNSIYEKFTRLIPSNKGTMRGQGLGLRIVKQFMEEMDGDLHLKSAVGKGSTFTLFVPFKLPLSSSVDD